MTKVYKPKVLTQEELDSGLKELFKKNKEQGQGAFQFSTANPLHLTDKKPPTTMHKPQKMNIKPTPLVPLTKQPEPEPEEEEPYWSAREWEQYFVDMYYQYPEVKKYLPERFVEAIEEEEQNS